MIDMITCTDSEMLRGLTFYKESRTLVAEFNTGALYAYLKVPYSTFLQVESSESRGKAMQSLIMENFEAVKICA